MLPTQFDLKPGFDVSGVTNLTRSQFDQALYQMEPLANVGLLLQFNSQGGTIWPSITRNPRFARYLWMEIVSASQVALKMYDQSGLDNYNNWITIGVFAINGSGSGGTATAEQTGYHVVTSSWTLPTVAPFVLTIPNTLQYTPQYYRATLFCSTDDPATGFVVGDEIDLNSVYVMEGIASYPMATIFINNSFANIAFYSGSIVRKVYHKTTGAAVELTNANWKVRIYFSQAVHRSYSL